MLRDKLANKGYYNFPALNTKAVDTMGAGMLLLLMPVCL